MADKVVIDQTSRETVSISKGIQGPTGPVGPKGDPGNIDSDTTNIPGSTSIANIVRISQSDYDNLQTVDENTLYLIF